MLKKKKKNMKIREIKNDINFLKRENFKEKFVKANTNKKNGMSLKRWGETKNRLQ